MSTSELRKRDDDRSAELAGRQDRTATSASRFRWRASCSRWSAFRSGIATRKGGKSAGYVNAIFLAFFGYYLAFVADGLAQQQKLPVAVALWLPNAVFACSA